MKQKTDKPERKSTKPKVDYMKGLMKLITPSYTNQEGKGENESNIQE